MAINLRRVSVLALAAATTAGCNAVPPSDSTDERRPTVNNSIPAPPTDGGNSYAIAFPADRAAGMVTFGADGRTVTFLACVPRLVGMEGYPAELLGDPNDMRHAALQTILDAELNVTNVAEQTIDDITCTSETKTPTDEQRRAAGAHLVYVVGADGSPTGLPIVGPGLAPRLPNPETADAATQPQEVACRTVADAVGAATGRGPGKVTLTVRPCGPGR